MSNPFNGSKFGVRGGNSRPSKLIRHETKGRSTSTLVVDAAKYRANADVAENPADYIFPSNARRSLSEQQGLGLFPPTLELEPADVVHRDPKTGYVIKVTRKNRLVWKSDRTLLVQGDPSNLKDPRFKRLTSQSKRIIPSPDDLKPAVIEIPVDKTELDIDLV